MVYSRRGGGESKGRWSIGNQITLFYTNVTSLRLFSNMLKLKQAIPGFKKEEIDIVSISETGVNWNKSTENTVKRDLRQVNHLAIIETSNVKDGTKENYQAGGTLTAVVGGATGSVTDKEKDSQERWSTMQV